MHVSVVIVHLFVCDFFSISLCMHLFAGGTFLGIVNSSSMIVVNDFNSFENTTKQEH